MTPDQVKQAIDAGAQFGVSPGLSEKVLTAADHDLLPSSTAFSPTDCPVLSRWAKILMMIQALISLLLTSPLAKFSTPLVGT